jgi:hypothetical protein
MKLENQVTSPDLSLTLEKLGVPQKSLFYWRIGIGKQSSEKPYLVDEGPRASTVFNYVSAFTVAELGEMLPVLCSTYKGKSDDKWYCDNLDEIKFAETEADARALFLIYLLENNLTPPA